MLAGVGAGITGGVGRKVRGDDLHSAGDEGREVGETAAGGLLQGWDQTGQLEERRERWKFTVKLPGNLARMTCGFPGNACWSSGPRSSDEWGKGRLEKEIFMISIGDGSREEGEEAGGGINDAL